MSIKGNTVGTPMPRTNWEQTDPKKADYLKGREKLQKAIDDAKAAGDKAKTAADNAQSSADRAKTDADAAYAAAQKAMDAAIKAKGASVDKNGDSMIGHLNVLNPTESAHAANKGYVDGLRSTNVVTCLLADGWSGESAPYTQTIEIAGVTSEVSCMPHVGVVLTDDLETALKEIESFSYISKGETGEGTITFTCLEHKPEVNIDIQIEVHAAGGTGYSGSSGDGSSSGGGNTGDVTIVGIASIKQTTTSTEDGGTNVITATLTNGTKSTFQVRNGSKGKTGAVGPQGPAGVGISRFDQTEGSSADNGTNTWRFTLDNGRQFTFSVKNGGKGNTGETGPEGPQGSQGIRGNSVLYSLTKPADYTTETAGVVPIKRITLSAIKNGSGVANVLAGDWIFHDSTLYRIYHTAGSYAYIDIMYSLKGETGDSGKDGSTGPQGPAGANGNGFFTYNGTVYDPAESYIDIAELVRFPDRNPIVGDLVLCNDGSVCVVTALTEFDDTEYVEVSATGINLKGADGTEQVVLYGQTADGRNKITVKTVDYLDDGTPVEQVIGEIVDGERGQDGSDGQRGTGILKVTTAPTSYTTTTGGIAPIKRMSISTIKTQAGVTEVLVGDQISYSYYLYHVYYLDDTYAYMDVSQSIRGAAGAKGSTGATGPQGPAYTLTEEDKQEIVEEVLAIVPGGSGGSSNVTTLGDTPIKLTAGGVVKLVCASECDYSVKTDTVVIADILNGAKTKVTVKEVDGNYQLNGDGTASAWYDQFLNIPITGLAVGETYNFVFDANGVTVSETTFKGVGHWILKDGSGTTVLTRSLSNVRQVHEFTASTEHMYLEWYPASNYYFQQNKNYSATVRSIYVNRAGTSDLSAVLDLTGTFTGSTTLGTIPAGATISAEPTATVHLITSADSDDSAQKALTDRTVVCFGDSMFGMYRGDNSVPAIVAEYTGATVHNVAFSGCRMSVHPTTGYAAFSMWALAKAIAENDWATQDAQVSSGSSYFPEQLELLKFIDFNDVDMIVIHYGTNDFAAGNAVSIDNSSDPDDYNTLCGALRYSVEKLLSAYPKLQIYVSVPVYRYWTDDSGVTTYAEDYIKHGHKLSEFVEALRNTAAEYNLPVIDGFHGMGVNRYNASAYLEDGTHHSLAGRKLFGEYIGGHLMSRQASAKSGGNTDGYSRAEIDAIMGSYIDAVDALLGGG